MKKIIILCLLLALSLCGCANRAATTQSSPAASGALNDLSGLGGAMLYSYLTALLDSPYDFEGQTFRLIGTYHETIDGAESMPTRSVCVSDVGGCCQAVVYLTGEADYPDDGTLVDVTGTLKVESGGAAPVCTLAVEALTVAD